MSNKQTIKMAFEIGFEVDSKSLLSRRRSIR